MNKLVTAGFLSAALLSACGQPLGQDATTTAKALSAQAVTTGTVSCPPYYKLCGNYNLATRPPQPTNIVPTDFIFTGTYDLYQHLGQSFTVQFPSSGYTKFYVNNLLLNVGELDKQLLNQKVNFKLVSIKQIDKVNYRFVYFGEAEIY